MEVLKYKKVGSVPFYLEARKDAAGIDLHSAQKLSIRGNTTAKIQTGVAIEMPEGCYGRICDRSSLAAKGIRVGGGVIDPDFRGEVVVILTNHSEQLLHIEVGQRIAQLIMEKFCKVQPLLVQSLSQTVRGEKGFGSTGE